MSTATVVQLRPGLSARNSKANPWGVKQVHKLDQYLNKKIYETLKDRCKPLNSPPEREKIQNAINALKLRLNGQRYNQKHFGELVYVKLKHFVINIDNQRDVDWDHLAHIINTWDPRIAQPINGIRRKDGTISVPEGQHTLIALYLLMMYGLLSKNFEVQCKIIDEDLIVPDSDLVGEAFGNKLFRIINYKGRKTIEPFYMHRSRVNGVRNYNSTLLEDVQSERIQTCVEENVMYTRPAIDARGRGAEPGMVTYITGLNKIAEVESPNFNEAIGDLDYALDMHNTYFANEKGVDGGFILALGRYAKIAREANVELTKNHTKALMKFFKQTYASPGKFHKTCKIRLKTFQKANDLKESWSDTCLCPILIMDFAGWCDKKNLDYPILPDKDINKWKGI
jgi:hypothetical protein